ncbi:hypothetical protein SPLC1_S203760 [Arthrospira platensis C1]|nr:hypothetical protein SPLC1_S203760 [Arthrospira platensis C1]
MVSQPINPPKRSFLMELPDPEIESNPQPRLADSK